MKTGLWIAKILALLIILFLYSIIGIIFLAGMSIGAQDTVKTFSQFSWTWDWLGKLGINIFTWAMLIYFGGMGIIKIYDTIVEITSRHKRRRGNKETK